MVDPFPIEDVWPYERTNELVDTGRTPPQKRRRQGGAPHCVADSGCAANYLVHELGFLSKTFEPTAEIVLKQNSHKSAFGVHIRRPSKLVRLTINAQIVFLLFGSSRKNVPAARSESADDHEGLLLKLDKRGVLLRADVLPLQVHFLKLRRAREPRSANLSGARSRMKRRTGYRLWMKRDVEKNATFSLCPRCL